MKRAIVVLLAWALAGPVQAGYKDWDSERKAIFWTYNTAVLLDLAQTNSALNDPCNCYQESNPVYGNDPDVNVIVGLNLVSSIIMYKMLDNTHLTPFDRKALWTVNVIRLGVVAHNRSLGVSFDFSF